MEIVTIHKAKTELSKLLKRVEAGEEIMIARGNKTIARISRAAFLGTISPERMLLRWPQPPVGRWAEAERAEFEARPV